METPTYSHNYLEVLEQDHKSSLKVRGVMGFAFGFVTALILFFCSTL